MKMSDIFKMPTMSTDCWHCLPDEVLGDLFDIVDFDLDYKLINESEHNTPSRLVVEIKASRFIEWDTQARIMSLSFDGNPFAVIYANGDIRTEFVSDMDILAQAKAYILSFKQKDKHNFTILGKDADCGILERFGSNMSVDMIDGHAKLTAASDYAVASNTDTTFVLNYDNRQKIYDAVVGQHTPGRDDLPKMNAAACAFYYHLLETIPPEDKFVLNQSPCAIRSYFPGLSNYHNLCAVVFRLGDKTYMITVITTHNTYDWKYENYIIPYKGDGTNIFDVLKSHANPVADKLRGLYFKEIL